jgi:hypothetical protein
MGAAATGRGAFVVSRFATHTGVGRADVPVVPAEMQDLSVLVVTLDSGGRRPPTSRFATRSGAKRVRVPFVPAAESDLSASVATLDSGAEGRARHPMEWKIGSQPVGRPARKLVSADPVWQHATVTTFTVIIIAERVG